MKTIIFVLNQESIPICRKRTFIALISKEINPLVITDFWTINLYNTIYKIVAEILVERSKPSRPLLASKEEGAFVSGRSDVLISQKVMHSLMIAFRRRSLMTVKIDIEKIYDRLRWTFLLRVLQHFRFHQKFVNRSISVFQIFVDITV